jgi:hypothetical protein
LSEKKDATTKAGVAQRNWEAFDRAYSGTHDGWAAEADKFNAFYVGDQWDEGARQDLESQGRPVLTINEIMTTVNTVLGEHSENRVDIRFKPRLHANEETARVLTHVVDQILDHNNYGAEEAQCFSDGIIADRGYLDVRMNFDESVMGEVEIRSLDPLDVVIDPDAKEYDPKHWSEVFVSRWHTLDEIQSLYGKNKAEELKGFVLAGSTYGHNAVRYDTERRFGNGTETIPTGDEALRQLRGVRVIERQHRKLAKRRMFVDLESGDTRPVPDTWEPERVAEVAERYGLGVTHKVVSRIRWTVSCDHVLLHDEWSPYDDFTVVPFFPLFRRGRISGLVRQLISPQEQLNKIESQLLHIVNTTANSGYWVEEGSLANMTAEELEQRGAETGLVGVYRKGRKPPEKIQPNQIPSGLDRLGTKSLQFIHEVAGTEALLGRAPKSEVSGVAMDRSQTRALVKLQPLMDNLARTRRLVAERVLRLVQQYYNETRVMRVTDWRQPTQPEVEVAINQPTPMGEILNNVTVGTYEVVVGTAPARDGALETEFAEALQLMEVGVPIPPEVVIRSSHLANKHEVAETVMKMQGRGEPTDEEAQMLQMQMEIQMQQAQLMLQEMQAKIMKLQAEAQMYASKAETSAQSAEGEIAVKQQKLQLEFERLQFDIARAEAELRTKLEMARTHTEARNAQGIMNMMAKRVDTERKIQGQLAVASLSRGSQNQPARG